VTNWRAAAALALLLALAVPPPPTDAALDWQRGPMTIDDATWTVTETKVWHGRNRDGVTVEGFGCCGYWRVDIVQEETDQERHLRRRARDLRWEAHNPIQTLRGG
jgi:hypothetical protein